MDNDIKANEATVNRPAGSRLLDASALQVDIKSWIDNLKSEEAWQSNDRNAITVFKSGGLTMVLSGLHTGAVIDDYGRGGLTIVQVLSGKILFTADGDEKEAEAGQIVAAHRDLNYFIKAIEETFLLLTLKD